MPHVITFESDKFDPATEEENPINPIAGQSVLLWLQKELAEQYKLSAPDPEDWGWYSSAETPEGLLMIGVSADAEQAQPMEWAIQIHKHRGMLDKMLGRNPHRADDPLTVAIQSALQSIGAKVLAVST